MRLLRFFAYGILAAGALATELVLSASLSILFNVDVTAGYFDSLTFFLIIAVLIEESFKFALLAKIFSAIDHHRSQAYPALVFGAGFGIFEIFSKFFSFSLSALLSLFSPAYLGVFLVHVITAGILGCFIAKRNSSFHLLVLPAILLSSFLHLLYNLSIIYDLSSLFISIYLAAISAIFLAVKNKLAK